MLGTFLFFAFHLEITHRHTCLFNRKHQVEGSKKLSTSKMFRYLDINHLHMNVIKPVSRTVLFIVGQ